MIETEFQRHLVVAARDLGGYAHKQSNRFLVGVLDLLVKLPQYPAVLIECKMDYLRRDGSCVAEMTVPQQKNMRKAQKAGMAAGWVVCCPAKGGHALLTGVIVDTHVLPAGYPRVRRDRGEPWPVEEVVKRIVNGTT